MIRVVFVDDQPEVLDGLRDRLRKLRKKWKMRFANSGKEVLELLEEEPADVLVTDMRMPVMDGEAVLRAVRERWTQTARVVLSGETDLDGILKALPLAHQYLSKPCDAKALEDAVERAHRLHAWLCKANLSGLIENSGSLPASPRVFNAVTEAVADPRRSITEIGSMIAQEPTITARTLQLANSAFFGIGRTVSTVHDALTYLGLDVVRSLLLQVELFQTLDSEKTHESFCIEALQQHALRTANIASRLVDNADASRTAFSAGILHDIGSLVLATNLPSYYDSFEQSVLNGTMPLQEDEYEKRGYSHAEVGGAILESWGLPYQIVEAVAFHHKPSASSESTFGAIGAVHVADRLAHQADPSHPSAAVFDEAYVSRTEIRDQIAAWQQQARDDAFTGTAGEN